MNVRLGLQNYLLLDNDGNLTDVGQALFEAPTDLIRYELLGTHILRNLRGSVFVETVRDMARSGSEINLNTLRQELEVRGVHSSTANKSMSILRLWLAKAGVFSPKGYRIDVSQYERLLGIDTAELAHTC